MKGLSCFECFQKKKCTFSSIWRCLVEFSVIFSHFWVFGHITTHGNCGSLLVFWRRSGRWCIMAYCIWRCIGFLPYFKIMAVTEHKAGIIKIFRFLAILLSPPGKLINLNFLFTNTLLPLLWGHSARQYLIGAVLAVKRLKNQKFA